MIRNTNPGVAYSQRRSAFAPANPSGDRNDAVPKTPIEVPTPPTSEVFIVKVACNGDMGRVSGNGLSGGVMSAHSGDSVTLTATPKTGYRFVQWYGVPSASKNTNPTVTFKVTSNLDVTAVFESVKPDVSVPLPVVEPASPSVAKNNSLKAMLKKYWWVLAILLGYWLYKEGKL